ncbi:Histidine kinase/DNA gyrase B [Quillaja saponaria]|uniref:Histidine kinase/DNA gyrase B n=1 Tax=Quillaja saponaria TaxID=32244 RepID=A0AAD7LC54_QUISA|nr:Histidine kinase/DNA gyrase B [Quillaja saponaria]
MYGHSPRFRPPGGGRHQQLPVNPPQNSNAVFQNPTNVFFQNTAAFSNQNFHLQNPNIPLQNPAFLFQNPVFTPQQLPNSGFQPQNFMGLDKIEHAVVKARHDLLAAGESVSAWKVAQAALLMLQVDSWNSLGFRMQEVPSLHRLMMIEGKVTAFIHCFVGVRRITSLYDLEVAICKNEGVDHFDELGLGPLLKYPLVIHYFSVHSEVTEVFKITSEEIIHFLCEFIDICEQKQIKVEEFLDFIAKKRSVKCRETLGLRVQNLGMHISIIREAKNSEAAKLKKLCKTLNPESDKKFKKRPLLSSLKKQIDERFSAISQRVESFSSTEKVFSGKHIRFVSSSSDDEASDNCPYEENDNNDVDIGFQSNSLSSHFTKVSDQVSSCPYPSASEEMTRLGLRVEMLEHTSANGNPKNGANKKKRKRDDTCTTSSPSKLSKKDDLKLGAVPTESGDEAELVSNIKGGFSITNDALKMFVTTWKEACQEHNVAKVLERMVHFYIEKPRLNRVRRKIRWMFSSYPFNALLNVAVSSIKCGMWDSIYDTFQAISQNELTDTLPEQNSEYVNIDVGPSVKNTPATIEHNVEHIQSISAEDIIRKIETYFELDNEILSDSKSFAQSKILYIRKLCNCQYWVAEQFCVKNFSFLGHGDFIEFLEKNGSLLPRELYKFLVGDAPEKSLMEASMLSNQLVVLVSQALNNLWENKIITRQMISLLLMRQFPSIGFKITENGSLEDFLHILGKHRSGVISKCVLFSTALIGTDDVGNSLTYTDNKLSGTTADGSEKGHKSGTSETVTSKDAIEVLLRAPMLSDLSLWSHWDHRFSPLFGPLVPWLLNEVNTGELLCLVTKDGKVIRINHASTADSFLEAAVQASSFRTAVELSSLFSVDGGEKKVSLSLLRRHACRAFEVLLRNTLENMEVSNDENSLLSGALSRQKVLNKIPTDNLRSELSKNLCKMDKAVPILSRFFLDCLGYIPAELHGFATDVLLSGMKSVCKGAASAILRECNKIEQRVMLHDVGLSCGIMEWDDDYCVFKSCDGNDFFLKGDLCLGAAINEMSTGSKHSRGEMSLGWTRSLSDIDSKMLKKQHARLGRALHCLSQELYSQDSHFLLELVQNADDNNYPENVEPTLTFILQESGIIVLNNEEGFSAQNIRALCDVGNSTKKGSNVGYIGKKGIGFKSVFRFDISEGQIGFVLPTVVAPCNMNLIGSLTSAGSDRSDNNCWNTCIVLPFRSRVSEATTMNSIIAMFSDLHPSLLLFLHRLQCLKLRNMLNDTLIVMRKEVVGDGIIKVSHGKEKMTWFVASQKFSVDSIRFDVQTTEISMAFTLQESDNGYSPCLEQQPVFAFLPLRTYGLKFILQGDFVLPSSREEVDGDSPWNQWLLSKYPSLFVSAEKSFCALPCFKDSPGKAVSAFMSFVPLVGEVHSFFSVLPRLVISKLRMSNCLLVEGDSDEWVPPCKVVRGWNQQARTLLPDDLLHVHLGLRYLDKDILLSDPLARALGVEEYGPRILLRVMSSLCHRDNGIMSMGLGWLASCLNALYVTLFSSSGRSSLSCETEEDVIGKLQKIPFIPLSDGTCSSVDEGTIWLHSEALSTGAGNEHKLEAFPNLCAKLRIVSPSLLSTSTIDTQCIDASLLDNLIRMLHVVGVQRLSAHEIVNLHILPAISSDKTDRDKVLMTEYLCFVMMHLKSNCSNCFVEREHIISELRNNPSVLTNYGFKRPGEVPIHFCRNFGNPVDVNKLIDSVGMKWHEVDINYINHPVNKLLSSGLAKWREFFLEIGVTDFVQTTQADKRASDVIDTMLNNVMEDRDLITSELIAKDWESNELVQLVSLLSRSGKREKCKYLLEVLDTLWDTCYSDKTTGYLHCKSGGDGKPFRTTFLGSIRNVQWVVSSMDDELHYPKDLFYDCEAVRMILGASAQYAVPKVKSERLTPFKASIMQMSKLYAFIWNEMASSKKEVFKELNSGPFIFVPYSSVSRHEDVIPGLLLTSQEVYWHDSTGCMDQMNEIYTHCSRTDMAAPQMNKTLCNLYPGLRGFFIDQCRVHENPPLRSYLQILLQLSSVTLPLQAANKVFQVFIKWADGLKSGLLSPEDIIYLKEYNIDFLYFGELNEDEKEMFHTKVSVLMKKLGIPALSELVTHEAICHGLADNSSKALLVNWALPFAQRYLYGLHADRYVQLKQTGFDILNNLEVIVVEKLFYRNIIASCGCKSKKQVECNCLLQENILYTTQEPDSHALFMELSRLFLGGAPDLHLANFLYMITTMITSGSSEEHIESFILNNQKLSKLPDKEPIWCLPPVPPLLENDNVKQSGHVSSREQLSLKVKTGISSNWPPVGWKSAPDFNYARANGFKTQAAQTSNGSQMEKDDNSNDIVTLTDRAVPISMHAADWTIKDESAEASVALILPESNNLENQSCPDFLGTDFNLGTGFDRDSLSHPNGPNVDSTTFSRRPQLQTGTPNAAHAIITGRLGEHLAYEYFVGKFGKTAVTWVNEVKETGLPYDIVVGNENGEEYIEVKATRSQRKDWFMISLREWQFAVDRGESFCIAHVVLSSNNEAKVSIFKNPLKLCKLGQLQLVVMMPKQQKDSIIS